MSLWALIAVLFILVVNHQDGIIGLLVWRRRVLTLLLLRLAVVRGDVYDLLATSLQAPIIHLLFVILVVLHLLLIVAVFVVIHLAVHSNALVVLVLLVFVDLWPRVEGRPNILFIIVRECIAACLLTLIALVT
jgi:hypothetical protein